MKINIEYQTGDELLDEEQEALFCRWAESVYRERVKQVAKWGDQRHADDTGGEYLKLLADQARTTCQDAAKYIPSGDPGWRLILNEEHAEVNAEREPGPLCGELVQTAAVTCAWWGDVKRRIE